MRRVCVGAGIRKNTAQSSSAGGKTDGWKIKEDEDKGEIDTANILERTDSQHSTEALLEV